MGIPTLFVVLFTSAFAAAQELPGTPLTPAGNLPPPVQRALLGDDYRIGQDDLLEVSVFEISELDSSVRVTAAGTISLPLIGVVSASGRTPQQLEREIEEALRRSYVKEPHVTVFIAEYASQPVSLIGAVNVPGIYQIKGQKSLLDMLALAGGVSSSAGETIQIIRRTAPSDGPGVDSGFSQHVIRVDVEDLFEAGMTELNIPIFAGDVINVLNAASVFVVGAVNDPGEYLMRNGRNVTATQAVALSGGFGSSANKDDSIVIRFKKDGSREEIPIDLGKMFEGGVDDFEMQADDIIFIPTHQVRAGFLRALESAIGIVTGRLTFR